MAHNESEIETIKRVVREQISGAIDRQRAGEYWQKILSKMAPENIVVALSEEISHFNYEEKKSCHCCQRV